MFWVWRQNLHHTSNIYSPVFINKCYNPWWLRSQRICPHCGRPRFYPWVGKIPWRRVWQTTPVFLPGESHGQRSPVGYSPWGRKESDRTEQLTLSLSQAKHWTKCLQRNYKTAITLHHRDYNWVELGLKRDLKDNPGSSHTQAHPGAKTLPVTPLKWLPFIHFQFKV